MSLLAYLHKVAARQDLTVPEARQAMLAILTGQASTPAIAAFLVALRMKGETSQELQGFAAAMREEASPVDAHSPGETLLDTCGTGGDGAATFNISTVAAFVVAGAGVRVAKHGNRSMSSQCGSADILEALGVRVDLDGERAGRAIREVGIGFLFAPMLHPAMKFAQPARVELKMRTVFNLLGPLTNPAGARTQLIGAPSPEAAERMAGALAGFQPERAFVVHGNSGLDEVSTTGPTLVFEIRGAEVERHTWTPEHFGIGVAVLEDLRGGGIAQNRDIARSILTGTAGPKREIVLVNAAAALTAAGRTATLREGMQRAAESIDSGQAWAKLEALAAFTNSLE